MKTLIACIDRAATGGSGHAPDGQREHPMEHAVPRLRRGTRVKTLITCIDRAATGGSGYAPDGQRDILWNTPRRVFDEGRG